MANNKMYEDYLMHYRTKGSKNGYTKYPGKYTPIGEKAIDSTGLNFNRYKNLQRFWEPKDGGEGPAMVADKAQVAVARAEHDRNARRAEARKKMSPLLNSVRATTMVGTSGYIKGKNEQNKRKQNQQEAEARRIAGGNPYVNRREENRKAAEQRRIAGGSGISASQRQKEAEARRIAGSSTTTSRDRMREAEARRIKGGSQGAPTANERAASEKRKNINDWYSNQVRGGNKSAAEARRIKGGTSGTTTQAAAESEKKKKKLKGVLKALLKSNSRGISRFL